MACQGFFYVVLTFVIGYRKLLQEANLKLLTIAGIVVFDILEDENGVENAIRDLSVQNSSDISKDKAKNEV